MTTAGIAIRDSRILKRAGVTALGLTIVSGVTLAVHGVWGVAAAAAVVAALILIRRRNSVVLIWLLASDGCELVRASSSEAAIATLHSSFEAFGLVILLFGGSSTALPVPVLVLVLAPDSIEPEQRRLLGLWLRSDAKRANPVAAPVS